MTEILLLLQHLMDGDVSRDPSVTMAAHALGTSILYHEESIRTVLTIIGNIKSVKGLPHQQVRLRGSGVGRRVRS